MATVVIFLVAYVVVTEFLDWTGRCEIIQKRWPKAGIMLGSRAFRVILILVAIGLLARLFLETKTATTKTPESAEQHSVADKSDKSAPSKADSVTVQKSDPCSANIAGSGNKIGDINCGKVDRKTPK